VKSLLRNRAIEERFLDYAGRPFAGAKGKEKSSACFARNDRL